MIEQFAVKVPVSMFPSQEEAKKIGLIQDGEEFESLSVNTVIKYEMVVNLAKWGIDDVFFSVPAQEIEGYLSYVSEKNKEHVLKRDVTIKIPEIPATIEKEYGDVAVLGFVLSSVEFDYGVWKAVVKAVGG